MNLFFRKSTFWTIEFRGGLPKIPPLGGEFSDVLEDQEIKGNTPKTPPRGRVVNLFLRKSTFSTIIPTLSNEYETSIKLTKSISSSLSRLLLFILCKKSSEKYNKPQEFELQFEKKKKIFFLKVTVDDH